MFSSAPLSSFSFPSINRPQKLVKRHTKRLGYPLSIQERDVSFPPFYCTHIRPMQPRPVRKLFLGVPPLVSQLPNIAGKEICNAHAVKVTSEDDYPSTDYE